LRAVRPRRLQPPVSFLRLRRAPRPPLFPYPTLFRSPPTAGRRETPGLPPLWVTPFINARKLAQEPAGQHLCHEVVIRFGRRLERSEEHTSELQSRENIVCRLLLEKKNGGRSRE